MNKHKVTKAFTAYSNDKAFLLIPGDVLEIIKTENNICYALHTLIAPTDDLEGRLMEVKFPQLYATPFKWITRIS